MRVTRLSRTASWWIALTLVCTIAPLMLPLDAQGREQGRNRLTFDNQSGQNAVVKLIGPSRVVARLQKDQRRSVRAVAGKYYLVVRYGSSEKEYSYARSAPFEVTEPDGQYSLITFVLHRRGGGSFVSLPATPDEFTNPER